MIFGEHSRRQVLRGVGIGIGVAAVGSALPGAAVADPAPIGTDRSIDFTAGWKFVLVNPAGVTDPTGAYADAADPGHDDSHWRTVDLPHDWSIELAPTQQDGTSSATAFLPGGLGWYRKSFTLPAQAEGRRISIEFDGIYSDAFVYLNGTLLGNHPYAYTGTNYDLTGLLHTDGTTPNVIAVRAQNQLPSSRWYSGSGIYRRVHLIVTDPVHVDRYGTFVTTPNLAATLPSAGAVAVATTVANDGSSASTVTVRTTVTDPHGRTVGQGSATLAVPAGQRRTGNTSLSVPHPTLWSIEDPALYQLRTEILVDGRIVDTTSTAFGFRVPVFDPNEGFSLNGTPMKLRGVDLHATQGPLGAVINPAALNRQLTLMKSMGVNAIRTAHNPPAPELVALCEQLGILLMVEAFDCWHTGKVTYDYHIYFDQWSQFDIAEMVNAYKNSPSVVLWSIGNETPDTGLPAGPGIAAKLVAAVRAIDPTRPVVMGSDQYRSVPTPGSPQDQILRELDGIGLNYDTAMAVDGLHAAYPDKFFFESESSSETSTRGVYQDPQLLNTGENYSPGRRGTSSYDNNLASWTLSGEYSLKKDRDRRFFAGQFLWAGQDYLGEPTPYDVFPVKSSFFGAVDTAGFPKDAYHLFRSQWTTAPMVHIAPMNWTDHAPGEPVQVWVYSTVDTVELRLDNRSLGVRTFDHKLTTDGRPYLETTEPTGDDRNYPSGSYTSPNGSTGKLHLTWTVPFQPGTLVAIASSAGKVVATDQLSTAGPARALSLTPMPQHGPGADGSLSFLTATVLDGHGVPVPSANNTIEFAVHGPGRIAAVDNGQQDNAHGYQLTATPAFNGTALAVIAATGGSGPITVVATSAGLAPATHTLPGSTAGQRNGPGSGAAGTAPIGPTDALTADASYSGAPDTVPTAMLDGNPSTAWSNYYLKSATATLNAVSQSRPGDWVSLSWRGPQRLGSLTVTFTSTAPMALPASLQVSYRTEHGLIPVRNPRITWAGASGQPTTITFDPVHTDQLRLTMTSRTPGTDTGFLAISQLGAG